MNQPAVRILLLVLLLLFILAPFAGLAPLLLVLLLAGAVSTVWSLLRVLISGEPSKEKEISS